MRLVYFSSVSENTKRFVEKLEEPSVRIPLYGNQEQLRVTEPFVLVTPTYGGGPLEHAVPKQVMGFLNIKENRDMLRGVIAGGNTNFGEAFGVAGDIIAAKCEVPMLYRFELFGTEEDVFAVNKGLELFWAHTENVQEDGIG